MPPDPHTVLHFGPYCTPLARLGRKLFCEIRGTVTVGGYHDAPILWPRIKHSGAHCLVLCGDLVKAVRREAELAVAHHWGVSINTVKAWRRALGVGRVTEGTHTLTSEIAGSRTDDRLERARASSKRPTALAKASASLKGRIQSPATLTGALRAAKGPRTGAWKQKMSAYWRKRGHAPGHPDHRMWTPAEDAILGAVPDADVARRIGRTCGAVQQRRTKLGIPILRRNAKRKK